ncbi:importin-11-like, partial [Saccoglossus kowalevskii]
MAVILSGQLLDTQHTYPLSYVPFIRESLELATTCVFTDVGKGILFERFIVNCMNLIKSIARCDAYTPARNLEETKDIRTIDAYKLKTAFFTSATLCEICTTLVSHYFLLTSEELLMWESDPEGFCADETGESFKFNLR